MLPSNPHTSTQTGICCRRNHQCWRHSRLLPIPPRKHRHSHPINLDSSGCFRTDCLHIHRSQSRNLLQYTLPGSHTYSLHPHWYISHCAHMDCCHKAWPLTSHNAGRCSLEHRYTGTGSPGDSDMWQSRDRGCLGTHPRPVRMYHLGWGHIIDQISKTLRLIPIGHRLDIGSMSNQYQRKYESICLSGCQIDPIVNQVPVYFIWFSETRALLNYVVSKNRWSFRTGRMYQINQIG